MQLWLLSTVWYAAGLATLVGAIGLVRPTRWLGVATRRRAAMLAIAGVAFGTAALAAGTSTKRIASATSLIDDVFPAYQFDETHAIDIRAAPAIVYQAVRDVTADEIALFHTLTTIRCLGRCPGGSLMNPDAGTPILESARRSGFRVIAERAGEELVVVTFVAAPASARSRQWTRDAFIGVSEPGYVKAAMNFRLEPGGDHTRLQTTTRVYVTDDRTLRIFTAYWRTIAPGSWLIRRSWLQAIRQRAERVAGAAP